MEGENGSGTGNGNWNGNWNWNRCGTGDGIRRPQARRSTILNPASRTESGRKRARTPIRASVPDW